MSIELNQTRQYLADYLTARGVNARVAWPMEERTRLAEPVAVVSLRGCQAGAVGFQDYLGERLNQSTGHWEELFGKRAELTFGLDLYAPLSVGEAGLQSTLDVLSQALAQGGPEGLDIREFAWEDTGWDQNGRLLKRAGRAVCQVYLYAAREPDGEFIDFEIRGERVL